MWYLIFKHRKHFFEKAANEYIGLVYKMSGCFVSPRSAVANVLDCDNVVSEFELQSSYYIHFRIDTFGKGINPLLPMNMG